jgi:glycosyltransferase involved in cell wall biosynthesis
MSPGQHDGRHPNPGMTAKPDTIAFVSTYSHPSRDSMEQMVRDSFPEYRVEDISVQKLIKRHSGWIAPNLIALLREYPESLVSGLKHARGNYKKTTYLFRKLHQAMREVIKPKRHVFSFQTQSMYDTSVPGVPHFLYTDHTHLSNLSSPDFERRNLRPEAWIRLERTVYENASLIFTRSSDVSADLFKHYAVPEQKVVCGRFGTNARIYPGFQPANDGYANQRVLFIGRDWDRKGGPALLLAFAEVRKTHPAAELVIVGASPDISMPNCRVLGDLSMDRLSALYASASIFCVPSRSEPFGVVFLEAMMHRLPVIASRIGALPDMVQEGVTGRLVPPNDPRALARALVELLSDPGLCRKMGEAGYAHAAGNYTWKKVGETVRTNILPFIT